MTDKRARRGLVRSVLVTCAKVAFLVAFVGLPALAGYGLSRLIFRWFTWRPTGLGQFVFEFLCAFAVLALCIGIASNNIRRHITRGGPRFGQNILEALDRISRGDFSVVLPVEHNEPLGELAESVNKMARDLGDIDQQRRDFVSNVSHEIQSPLTSISGFAALLHNPELDATTRDHYLEIIESESKRLSQLSDNLLKLSALQDSEAALKRAPIALDEQLVAVAGALEPQLQAKTLALRVEAAPVTFTGDRELLDLVWINLLQNACKYTPAGGAVTVRLTVDGDRAIVAITDTGIGMSPSELLHVFERFYRADKSRSRAEGGAGLGLALVKEIVEAHGGQVTAASQPGQSATFTVTLPLAQQG